METLQSSANPTFLIAPYKVVPHEVAHSEDDSQFIASLCGTSPKTTVDKGFQCIAISEKIQKCWYKWAYMVT